MLIVTLYVNAPIGAAEAVRETLGMYCEEYPDTRVIRIEEVHPEQLRMSENQGSGAERDAKRPRK